MFVTGFVMLWATRGAKISAILWIILELAVFTFYVMLLALDVMTYESAAAAARMTAILWIAVDLILVTGFVALAALDLWMVQEVNRSVTEGYRLDYCRWSWETREPRTVDMHKQLFPDSKVNRAYRIILVIWAPFGIVGFFRILNV